MNDTPENDNVIQLKPKTGRRKNVRNQKLTNKQMKFAEGVAAGLPFEQAYKNAYNCSGMQARTIYTKSRSELKHNQKIKDEVERLKAQLNQVVTAKLSGASIPGLNKLPKVITDAATGELQRVSDVLITRQTLTHKLLYAVDRAYELGQVSAAVGALTQLGKLHQLTSDNRESAKMSEFDQMTPDQLKEYIRAEIQKAGTIIDMDGLIEFVDMRPLTTTKQ